MSCLGSLYSQDLGPLNKDERSKKTLCTTSGHLSKGFPASLGQYEDGSGRKRFKGSSGLRASQPEA